MLSRTEVERLAAMANALRPDWPVASLCTFINTKLTARAYRDVACALAYIGTDPLTQTPARLEHPGPWWKVTVESRQPPVGRPTPCGVHPDHPALNCPECKQAPLATEEQIKAARQRARELAANPPAPDEEDS